MIKENEVAHVFSVGSSGFHLLLWDILLQKGHGARRINSKDILDEILTPLGYEMDWISVFEKKQ